MELGKFPDRQTPARPLHCRLDLSSGPTKTPFAKTQRARRHPEESVADPHTIPVAKAGMDNPKGQSKNRRRINPLRPPPRLARRIRSSCEAEVRLLHRRFLLFPPRRPAVLLPQQYADLPSAEHGCVLRRRRARARSKRRGRRRLGPFSGLEPGKEIGDTQSEHTRPASHPNGVKLSSSDRSGAKRKVDERRVEKTLCRELRRDPSEARNPSRKGKKKGHEIFQRQRTATENKQPGSQSPARAL